jgi:hypothetical protein
MVHTRSRNWKADALRKYSAIYKLVLNTGVRFVAYDLPERFKNSLAARNFAERWSPNQYLANLIVPLQVCELRFREDKLGQYLQRVCQTGELCSTT